MGGGWDGEVGLANRDEAKKRAFLMGGGGHSYISTDFLKRRREKGKRK